jgi:uridine phosphorylase
VPSRLRPTAPTAASAVLAGDPGRALLLAQELLDQPKMSNHARGLWGYYGHTPAGDRLTIQSTGIGGPSAALVLGDLAELGVEQAIRVGTCVAVNRDFEPGELVLVRTAVAAGGSAAALGIEPGEAVAPSPRLTERLLDQLGDECRAAAVTSVDAHPGELSHPLEVAVADMQTAPLLARGRMLKVEVAAVLIVAEGGSGEREVEKDELEELERRAGRAASAVLSG